MIYVCDKCFSTKTKENYECLDCGSNVIFEIDDLCAPSVIYLNKMLRSKNIPIRTVYSCEGHFRHKEYIIYPYILFSIQNIDCMRCMDILTNITDEIYSKLDTYGLIYNNNEIIENVNNILNDDEFDGYYNLILHPPKPANEYTLIEFNKWKFELWNMVYIVITKCLKF